MSNTDPATVLVVDDEPSLADIYTDWIETATSHAVRTAYDGETALECVQNVDVVLLDRRLPEYSGRKILDVIEGRDVDCRVAMVTAVELDVDVLDMPFDDYLTKPVERGELLATVTRLLRRAEYHEQAQMHFSLVSKRARLETQRELSELVGTEEYRQLNRRIERSQARLDEMMAELDEADYRTLFADIHAAAGPSAGEGPAAECEPST